MLSNPVLSEAFDVYQRRTLEAIAEARKLALLDPVVVDFSTSTLAEPEIKRVLDALPKVKHKDKMAKSTGFLYVFVQKEGCSVGRAQILAAIQHAKTGGVDKEKAMRNLCAVNEGAADGRVLYVGRSWDPRARIGGHLRSSASGTYAIHFEAWAQSLGIQVELFMYAFGRIDDRVLQVLEDAMWDKLRPLFGRRGEK